MPAFPPPSAHRTHSQSSTRSTSEDTHSQWLFTPTELRRAPSILDGMSVEQERANRHKGVNFLTNLGIALKLQQTTISTAAVYLHRFYMRHSMVDLPDRPGIHQYTVAATAMFLATKVDEDCRKMRELVVACCRVAQKQRNLVVDEQSKEYWKWRDTILHNEDLLLEALCFDLQIEPPYRILRDLLHQSGVEDNKLLRNTSWAFLNDSQFTTVCLLHSPRIVACSALFAGAIHAGVAFPDDDRGRPWWEQLKIDIFELRQACNIVAEMYENTTLPGQDQRWAYVKNEGSEPMGNTRIPRTPRYDTSARGSVGKRERDDDDESRNQDEESRDSANPKRQRRASSASTESRQREALQAEVPTVYSNGDGVAKTGNVDAVQQRIDEIVNAHSRSEDVDPHPPMSRQPSYQLPPRPASRHSSSSSIRRPPTSASGDFSRGQQERPPESRRSHSGDREHHARRPSQDGEYGRVRPTSRSDDAPAATDLTADEQGGQSDNGSEEGEL